MTTTARRPRPSVLVSAALRGRRLLLAVLLAIGLGPALAGCSTPSRSWPGVPPEQVWTAMKSAAAAPDYDGIDPDTRWNVDENQVRVIEEQSRIEIYRELDRRRVPAGGAPVTERRIWRFGITLEADSETPVVTFRSRGVSVPMHVLAEAQRYFDQVDAILAPYAGLVD